MTELGVTDADLLADGFTAETLDRGRNELLRAVTSTPAVRRHFLALLCTPEASFAADRGTVAAWLRAYALEALAEGLARLPYRTGHVALVVAGEREHRVSLGRLR
jgi:hypothetical protein